MTKAELRKIYKEKRKLLSNSEVEKFTDCILINFQKIQLPFVSCVHTYMASEKLGEPGTSSITRYLQFKNPGLKVLVPKIDIASGTMQHFHFDDDVEFESNVFGISEPASGKIFSPAEIELALIPLLAYDLRGFRVGYGKGYYDRFLAECRKDIIKIGLSFFEPEELIDDINQFDIPLNYCITPDKLFEF